MTATPGTALTSSAKFRTGNYYGRFFVQISLKSGRLGLLALCFLLFTALVSAQSVSGELVGTIYDPTGATIPAAAVVATHVATGVQSTAVSSSTGQYRLGNLAAGVYALRVTATGFSGAELKGVQVNLNLQATANVTLQVGESKTTVEVTGSAVTIDTTTAQVQSTFETRQLADLPVTSSANGVLNLALLTSGVGSSGSVGAGIGPSVGGQRPRNNNFTIEGIDNNSKSTTGPLTTIPNDAVAEFSILANQFSPQYGHSSGGQFNQGIKSGTNEFHGMLYEYMNNRNLNAADQVNVVDGVEPHARYDNNRFGGNIGGPIKRNKLFFFFDYEYQAIGQSGSGGQIFAPTTAGYATLASIPGVNTTNLSVLKQYMPAQSTAVDPSVSGAYPVVGGKTIELGQYSFLAPNYTNNSTYVVSADYSISDKDQLRGRFVKNNSSTQDTAASLPEFWVPLTTPTYLATLTEFHNFTPNLTNEFRLGFNRYAQVYNVGPQSFPGLDQFPNITIDELGGVNIGPDSNAPQMTVQNTYQLTDNVNWTKGAHNLSFGVDAKKFISPQTFTQRQRGDYWYTSLSGYLMDQLPDEGVERNTGGNVYYGDQVQFGAYVNDSWKVRPNFTVNVGVRYERTTIPYGERLQSVNAISNVPGLISFGEPTVQNLNFAPRVGLAWSPGKSGNTSVRAGFGINYDQLFDNLGILSEPPQLQQTVNLLGLSGYDNFLANGGIKPNASAGTLSQADARANTSGYIPDQKLPKSIQWNFGIQHVFHEDYTIEVRYLGSRGLNLPIQDRLNVQNVVNSSNALPVYMSTPSQATLDGLTSVLSSSVPGKSTLQSTYDNGGNYLPSYLNAGFQNAIAGFMPVGSSTYHGLAAQITRRFHNGLQFVGSYTLSHNIDDSTAEVFSTNTTPRRPQDFQNLRAERSSSALDHRNRFTLAVVYDLPYFKSGNWFMRNIVGNWELAPVYTYQTGSWVTAQSAVDSNMNGDTAGDRTIINAEGQANIGSGTTALTNSNGEVVAYVAKNPNARYIQAPKGTIATGGRNTFRLRPIDNIDASLLKRFTLMERYKLELGGRFFNMLNHAQYTGGYLSDVGYPDMLTAGSVKNFTNPSNVNFQRPDMVFSSNPRTIQVSAKFIF